MLIRKFGEPSWHAPEVTAYYDEQAIQALLAESPNLLPGAGNGYWIVAREVALQSGYVDLIGVDGEGAITLVESKLRANPEIRRHVVGQVLAYAASLWGMSYDEFDQVVSSRIGAPLAKAAAEKAEASWDEEAFRASVAANLDSGRLRLVIAVDHITEELQRIVRFVNAHTVPSLDVLALELRYVADSGVEIIFPSVYGEGSAASKPTAATGQPWNEDRFFSALAMSATPEELQVAREFYDYARERGAVLLWGNGPLPSVSARMTIMGKPASVFSLYEWPKGKAKLAFNFEYCLAAIPEETLAQIATGLRQISGVQPLLEGLEQAAFKKRPGIPLALLVPSSANNQLRAILDTLHPSSD